MGSPGERADRFLDAKAKNSHLPSQGECRVRVKVEVAVTARDGHRATFWKFLLVTHDHACSAIVGCSLKEA